MKEEAQVTLSRDADIGTLHNGEEESREGVVEKCSAPRVTRCHYSPRMRSTEEQGSLLIITRR